MLINRIFSTLCFCLALGLPLLTCAAEAATVPNRPLSMNLVESAGSPASRNLSNEAGKIRLADDAIAGFTQSSTIEAPISASHLGIRWSASFGDGALGLAIRTSLDRTRWSPWIDVEIDTHMTDHGSKQFYGKLLSVPGGIRYIQYSVGMSRTEADALSPALTSLDISFIDASPVSGSELQQVVTDAPDMLSRTEWGCPDGEESPNLDEVITDVSHLIVHHTATTNSASDWSAEVRAMWSYHAITRGWGDIGYNFLVDPTGTVYVGRAGGDNVRGAHFSCQNTGTQGIAVIGDFTNAEPTDEALDSLDELLAWLASREDLDPVGISYHQGTQLNLDTISGHRDGNPSPTACSTTACPGDTFYPMLPEVRLGVEALIAGAQVPDPIIRDQLSSIVAPFTGDPESGKNCFGMFEIAGEILANIHTAEHGCNLYRLDADGDHKMLSGIDTTPLEGAPVELGDSPPFLGKYYFEGSDESGNGFWSTDGHTVERVVNAESWPEGGVLSGRGLMNGRLYFSVRGGNGEHVLYSTDGTESRIEPPFDPEGQSGANLEGTLFDALLFSGNDPAYGEEPWHFDGSEYGLLLDIVPGPEGSQPGLFLPLDDHWLFAARKSGGAFAFFSTDSISTREIPLVGEWLSTLDDSDPRVKASGAIFLADNLDPPAANTDIMRLSRESARVYPLGNATASERHASLAELDGAAYALVENRIFRLGESNAEEVPYNFPTDQTGSSFEFVGSNPNFPFAYVMETGANDYSLLWAWSEGEIGRLLAGNNVEITSGDHFVQASGETWFYGEDSVNGRALRKINNSLPAPTPWLGAVTGAWYDPETSGQGFVLHAIDNRRSVISFYGYEDDSTPLWLLGTGEAPFEVGKTSEITLHASSGGNFGSFTPDQVETVPWGTLNITFNTCRDATAELDGQSGRQAMNMVRLSGLAGLECYAKTPPLADSAGITGTWYDPATSGQGFVLHSLDDERIVISFYGYRDDSQRLWLLGVYEGQVTMDAPLVLDMTLASGGDFGNFVPGDITRSNWGTLSIEFDDCSKATATLSGLDGEQTMSLQKLASLQGSELNCP